MDRCALSKTQTPPTVLDFDWSPIVDHELVTVTDEGMLAVWHTKQPNCPQQQIGPTDVRFVRVFYAPSGDQILTLPDKVGWPKHGLGVWNAHNFQNTAPRLWRFDGSQSVSDHPLPSDPVVIDVAWRTCVTSSRESMQLNYAEETEECFKPEVEFNSANGSDNSTSDNPQTELVTLSVDHTLRIYSIHSAFVHGSKLPEDVPVDSTDSSREKHSGAGDAVSDSSTSFVANNAPTAITSRRHLGSMSGFTRHKASCCYHLDGQQQASRTDDSVSRPPLTSTDFGKMGTFCIDQLPHFLPSCVPYCCLEIGCDIDVNNTVLFAGVSVLPFAFFP
ncbi:hypothetical protein P879_11397 [Paragonimus westermani]|uniref:Uncharacterized protein n=1 Tax=Paragonimus westermani TaxID=34504 RepID=A0A8T0D7Y2_9TREM|nr:hypothetical protein P879_11397 [Paragonimus westermani]